MVNRSKVKVIELRPLHMSMYSPMDWHA